MRRFLRAPVGRGAHSYSQTNTVSTLFNMNGADRPSTPCIDPQISSLDEGPSNSSRSYPFRVCSYPLQVHRVLSFNLTTHSSSTTRDKYSPLRPMPSGTRFKLLKRFPFLNRQMNIGIVGHEAAKFTTESEAIAREVIRYLLEDPSSVLVSGHCPLGGIDIWAEEEAIRLNRHMQIFSPQSNSWETGFKPRNLQIANTSDIVHCIVVSTYPLNYIGRRFPYCYHCHTSSHIKSGGCWTALKCPQHEWWIL